MAEYPALDLAHAPGAHGLADLLYAALDDFAPLAIQDDENGEGWRVFFRTASARDAAAALVASSFGDRLTRIAPVDVPDEDWARRSQAALGSIRIGRITVAPPWDMPEPGTEAGAILIVIEPSMGFGTGHHETTRLCLGLLQSLELSGRRVLDVGTGSGVLGIAASKLGAASVVAVDHDADALANARDNIGRNAADRITVREADLTNLSWPASDVLLANLTGAALRRHAGPLMGLAAPDAHLILSGFGADEVADIADALQCVPARVAVEGSWAAMDAVRRPPTGA